MRGAPNLPTDIDEVLERFDDVPSRARGFYRRTFAKGHIAPGSNYLLKLAEYLHQQGENLLSLMILERALPEGEAELIGSKEGLDLLTLKVRVLHGIHSYSKARQMATALLCEVGTANAELIGNLASIIKSQALAQTDPEQRINLLRESMDYYARVFSDPELKGSYWLGVNALALGVCLGEFAWVRTHLEGVIEDCESSGSNPDDFWRLATLAELSLIDLLSGSDTDSAKQTHVISNYAAAERVCRDLQQRKSARRNIRLLLSSVAADQSTHLEELGAALDRALRPAQVVLFTGHRIDQADRPSARFPLRAVPDFRDALHGYLDTNPVDIGFSSAANGGDLLFIDTLLVRGITAHAILPFNEDQFRDRSVRADADDTQWQLLYDSILSGDRDGTVVWHASQSQIDDDVVDAYYAYANRVILGMGILKAQELQGELSGLGLIEPSEDHSGVGSLSAAREWSEKDIAVKAWRPSSGQWESVSPTIRDRASLAAGSSVVSRTILFADVMGFSKLSEPAIAGFCEGVLGGVGKLLAALPEPPLELNTWGDGIFAIFETASGGAEFALQLCEMMETNNALGVWPRYRLPDTMSMRVSLHSAPVRCLTNPLTVHISHWGQNVSLAARIEPITLPNQVFGSVATAALMATEGSDGLAADFVGMVPLAKNFGSLEIFSIRRS